MNILEMIKGRSVIAPVLVVDAVEPVIVELSTESDCVAPKGKHRALTIDECEELESHELMMNGCDNLIDLIS